MNPVYEKVIKCYECVRKMTDFEPKIGITLGSGLGGFADKIKCVKEVSYKDIEGFPVSTVPGHAGKFVFGYLDEVPVVVMSGRVHYYEGYDITDVVLPIRLMKLFGAEVFFVTNAAGGVNRDFNVGDLMMITNHISSFVPNPLIGENIEEFGTRFPDMTDVYTAKYQEIIKKCANDLGINIKQGTYCQTTGPSFETPAEVDMFRILGADAVGMSTVTEAITARHMGMKIAGISLITNKAAGLNEKPLTHEEVKAAGDEAAPKFEKIVKAVIKEIYQTL
ncbi:MAG: purine-nucleoside phosphorylase [Eubacterium sp.]|nr:purine-nucleoside phosphorylase [Eubacterium sp.]